MWLVYHVTSWPIAGDFGTWANSTEISREKFPEYQKCVEGPNSVPFDQAFRKFLEGERMERKFSGISIFRGWLHNEFQPGLKFQPGQQGWDFSPGSERNPLEMKVAITWRFLYGWISARAENVHPELEGWKTSCNRSKISARVEMWVWAGALTEYSAKQNGGNEKIVLKPGLKLAM